MIDPDTNLPHKSPAGLENQGPRTANKGLFYCDIKLRHFIITELQEAYPELKKSMINNPNASGVLSAFLPLIALEVRGKLTSEMRRKILETYKVI